VSTGWCFHRIYIEIIKQKVTVWGMKQCTVGLECVTGLKQVTMVVVVTVPQQYRLLQFAALETV